MCLQDFVVGEPSLALEIVDILGDVFFDPAFVMEHLAEMVGWCSIEFIKAQEGLGKLVEWLWLFVEVFKGEDGFGKW